MLLLMAALVVLFIIVLTVLSTVLLRDHMKNKKAVGDSLPEHAPPQV